MLDQRLPCQGTRRRGSAVERNRPSGASDSSVFGNGLPLRFRDSYYSPRRWFTLGLPRSWPSLLLFKAGGQPAFVLSEWKVSLLRERCCEDTTAKRKTFASANALFFYRLRRVSKLRFRMSCSCSCNARSAACQFLSRRKTTKPFCGIALISLRS